MYLWEYVVLYDIVSSSTISYYMLDNEFFFRRRGRYLLFGRITISDIQQDSSQYLGESRNCNVYFSLRQ